MTAPAIPPVEIYATFVDGIENATIKRVVAGLALGTQNKVSRIHLLLQSHGGMVGDGICLYNFFKTLPVDLTLYNTGKVESIATVAFLGAKQRRASTHSAFMIHRTHSSPQRATANALAAIRDSVALDDTRTEEILREHLKLSDTQWRDLDHYDLTLSAKDALACGLVHEIAEWAPPAGAQIYTL